MRAGDKDIIVFDPKLKLWERQPREGERHYRCFKEYRDQGDGRSIRSACEKCDEHLTTVHTWTQKYRWKERIAAWDREMDLIKQRESRKVIKEMAARHAEIMRATMAALQQPLQEIARRVKTQTLNLTKMSDKELLNLVRMSAHAYKDVVEIERVANGAPASVQLEVQSTVSSTVADTVEAAFRAALVEKQNAIKQEAPSSTYEGDNDDDLIEEVTP